jgi:acyl carrier protein
MSVDDRVRRCLIEVLGVEDDLIAAELALDAIDDWDSLVALRLLTNLERDLGATLDFDAFMAAQTVGDISRLAAAADAAVEADGEVAVR